MTSRRHFINVFARSAPAAALTVTLGTTSLTSFAQKPPVMLLNVSYDPTRELYVDYNATFSKHWKATTGQDVNFYRPAVSEKPRPSTQNSSPKNLFTINQAFGGRTRADKEHFSYGGSFDQIYVKK